MTARDTNAAKEQFDFRAQLEEMFSRSPIPLADRMTNLGLYIRGSALVKFLVLNDLYLRIRNVPGAIVEFGCWYGQNLVVFENLRAIYEPFNKTRQIVGFDSFTGYVGHSERDARSAVFAEGNFDAPDGYQSYLERLLVIHEGNNVLGHIRGRHKVVRGDICQTAPRFFAERPEFQVALAYLDVGLYEPTKVALEAVKPRLLPGSVVLLDEFTWDEAKGEAIAFREVFGSSGYRIEQSAFTPMRAIVTML